jgi:muramoyltetrapeptide carboxypeptidase
MKKKKTSKSKTTKKVLKKTEKKTTKKVLDPRAVIGIVAPSSPAPLAELEEGVRRMEDAGFEVFCHPQVKRIETFFAGSDAERALAFLDYAFDPELQVVWAARGGYGAVRILPILDEITEKAGKPEPKTFVGFSDATLLLEYVRVRWGWRALHAPMPATQHIGRVKNKDWKRFTDLVAGDAEGFEFKKLKAVFRPDHFAARSSAILRGPLVGGNLAMIQSVLGTPYAFDLKGKILFLEEIAEAPYRMDRMVQQLLLAGAFEGVKAIVLGTFTDCKDAAPMVSVPSSKGKKTAKKKLLRPLLGEKEAIETIFGELGESLGIPVFYGLPVGHGDGPGAIELGLQAELHSDGVLRSVRG